MHRVDNFPGIVTFTDSFRLAIEPGAAEVFETSIVTILISLVEWVCLWGMGDK